MAHRPTGGHSRGIGPLRWLPATPQPLRDDPHWGPYLTRRGALVSELADQVRHTARSWTHGNAPAWARPLLGTNAALAAEIAVFRAAVGVAEEDTRLLGAEQYPARTRAIQLLLQTHAAQANGRPGADTSRWHTSSTASIRASAPTTTGPNSPPTWPRPPTAAPTCATCSPRPPPTGR